MKTIYNKWKTNQCETKWVNKYRIIQLRKSCSCKEKVFTNYNGTTQKEAYQGKSIRNREKECRARPKSQKLIMRNDV